MLRKTHHQRDSMKRTPVYDSYSTSLPLRSHSPTLPPRPHSPSPYSTDREVAYKPNNDPDAVTIYKSNSRVESPEWSPNEMVRMSEKYSKEGAWDGNEAVTNDNDGAWGGETSTKTTDNNVDEASDEACALPPVFPRRHKEPKITVVGEDGLTRVEIAPGVVIEGYCADV